MKQISRLIILCSVLIALSFGSRADAPQSAPVQSASSKEAYELLEQLRASTKTPAISGAVAKGGKIVFSGGVGFIDVENSIRANGESVYNIGSLSKAVTAVAVMQLVQQSRVALEDDIRKYVPDFPDKGAKITIRHLLTHTSGIRHYRKTDFPGTPDNENTRPVTWQEGLKFFSNDPLLFPPGKYFFYTSYGVNLLQGVVEKASGLTFEDYMLKHVWQPAGMTSASFDVPDQRVSNRVHSYRIVDGKPVSYYYNDLRYKFASGGMIASAEDLVKLGIALNHNVLLRAETRDLLLSPQVHGLKEFREGKPPARMQWMQAMLWRLRRDSQGRPVAYECGSVKGSNACLVDYVKEDLVAAIATNSWECCGYTKVDALVEFFRKNKRDN
jgi:CubicO group peptidase (beta-lactamase class C family)